MIFACYRLCWAPAALLGGGTPNRQALSAAHTSWPRNLTEVLVVCSESWWQEVLGWSWWLGQVYWDQEQFCGSWLNTGERFIIGSPLLAILFGASWFCAHAGGTQPSWLTPALPSGLVSLLLWSALCCWRASTWFCCDWRARALFAIWCIVTTSQGWWQRTRLCRVFGGQPPPTVASTPWRTSPWTVNSTLAGTIHCMAVLHLGAYTHFVWMLVLQQFCWRVGEPLSGRNAVSSYRSGAQAVTAL